jgi:hypothetical protein
MTPSELKHYLVHSGTTNGLANAVANGVICWLLIKNKGDVTWWGHSNFGGDLLATAFILPFIVALIVIPLQRSKRRKGKLSSPDAKALPSHLNWVLHMPKNLWARASLFGLIGTVAIAGPTLLALFLVGTTTFTPLQYALFKGLWAGLLAAILVCPMITLALVDELLVDELEQEPAPQ